MSTRSTVAAILAAALLGYCVKGSLNYALRPSTASDSMAVSVLVRSGFEEFVAPDWEPDAREVFGTESSPDRFHKLLGEAAFASVAVVAEEIVGVIVLPQPNLLAFPFVRRDWHKQGIARALWELARHHLEACHPEVKTVELNSSPHAVAAYRALGFYPISEQFKRGGGVATRMACWLPGRALAASPPHAV